MHYTYPGVYIEEVPSGARTIVGVPTSIAVFIGHVGRGPWTRPVRCLSYNDFDTCLTPRKVGVEMARSVRLFFENGGHECFVIRLRGVPTLEKYMTALAIIEEQVDLFNLLVLPRGEEGVDPVEVWDPASELCRRRRAFLLMDPPSEWDDPAAVTDPASGRYLTSLRAGLVRDHAAVFYPDLVVPEEGRKVRVGPGGAIAGLMARTDSDRGVWKAPAGLEAEIRGVVGPTRVLTDEENGELNRRGVNAIRRFPQGTVSWGARTMDGDDDLTSEWKYIPIRRLALYIEESLYRGTHWVVFEPNDEPLWAQIRLNVGAFIHGLFRQGAFQGTSPKDAYFVKCDKETTTQDDINRGVVNIVVGFAPLKPAEFVVIKISQMAGNIPT